MPDDNSSNHAMVYAVDGDATCVGDACGNNSSSNFNGLIYVWPAVEGDIPGPQTQYINAVCATMGGKVLVIPSYVNGVVTPATPETCL